VSQSLVVQNWQPARRVNVGGLRRAIKALLSGQLSCAGYHLGIQLVGSAKITELNEQFLRHGGPTDVITFDYADPATPDSKKVRMQPKVPCPSTIHGEIFVCVDEAVSQAKRFGTHWETELFRYVVHGILHLLGYDDRTAAARRQMKAVEDRLVKERCVRLKPSKPRVAHAKSSHRPRKQGPGVCLEPGRKSGKVPL
jgi:rRNA maturation RNase YbeY